MTGLAYGGGLANEPGSRKKAKRNAVVAFASAALSRHLLVLMTAG